MEEVASFSQPIGESNLLKALVTGFTLSFVWTVAVLHTSQVTCTPVVTSGETLTALPQLLHLEHSKEGLHFSHFLSGAEISGMELTELFLKNTMESIENAVSWGLTLSLLNLLIPRPAVCCTDGERGGYKTL